MNWENHFQKNEIKIKKKQKIIVKMPHEIKNHWREREIWFKQKKLGLEWTMNGLRKPFRKKIRSKKTENMKNQSEIDAWEQITISEKAYYCSNTVFSLYFSDFTPQNHSRFSLHFRHVQNRYNLNSKIVKKFEQILKKDSASIQFKFFEL